MGVINIRETGSTRNIKQRTRDTERGTKNKKRGDYKHKLKK